MSLKWVDVKESLPERLHDKVLAFSPVYNTPATLSMRFRILDGQFVRICTDVSKWIYLSDLEKEIE